VVLVTASLSACAQTSAAGPVAGQATPVTSSAGSTEGTLPGATPPPPAIDVDRRLGTPHPTVLLGAARDGSWLAICQAREDTNHDGHIKVEFGMHGDSLGDRLVPYLLLRPGSGREITRFLRSDQTGRWLVYVHDGKRWLLDTHAGREIDLDGARPSQGAVSSTDGDLAGNPAWTAGLDFDDEGKYLLFVAAGTRGRRLAVLRRLADGRETEIDSGPGLLWWAGFAKEGPYVVMRVVERDTNGDGALDLPRTMTDRDSSACSTNVAVTMTTTRVSDELSWRIARIGERSARAVPGFETVFGNAVVRRGDSGALELDGKGPVRQLFPAACGARVVFANPSRDALVVSCAHEGNAVYVLQGGRRLATGCVLTHPDRERRAESAQVTCTDGAGPKKEGFISERELEIRILRTGDHLDGTELVRSALAGPSAAWQRRELLRERPEIVPPNVELCSPYWTVDLESGTPSPPGKRRVTRGTTSGQVLAASGAQGKFLDLVALGPLFWSKALDPSASCPSFDEEREEFYRRHPAISPR
jgi:hypothetical protein